MIKRLTILALTANLVLFSCSKNNQANDRPKEGEAYTLEMSNGSAAAATFSYSTSVESNKTATVNVNSSKKVVVYAKPGEYITITVTVPASNIMVVTDVTVTDSKGVRLPVVALGTGSAFNFLAFDPNDAVKDPNSYKTGIAKTGAALLANAKLKLKSWTITENGQITDYYSTMSACMKDDVFSLPPNVFNLEPTVFRSRLSVDFGSSLCLSSEGAGKEIFSGFSIVNNNTQVLIPVYSQIELTYNMEAFTLGPIGASDKTVTFSRTRNGGISDLVVFDVIR